MMNRKERRAQRLVGEESGLRGKYTLRLGTAPESLTETELATLLALVPQLTKLSNLPGFDPTDVTVTLTFTSTGHTACAKLAEPESSE